MNHRPGGLDQRPTCAHMHTCSGLVFFWRLFSTIRKINPKNQRRSEKSDATNLRREKTTCFVLDYQGGHGSFEGRTCFRTYRDLAPPVEPRHPCAQMTHVGNGSDVALPPSVARGHMVWIGCGRFRLVPLVSFALFCLVSLRIVRFPVVPPCSPSSAKVRLVSHGFAWFRAVSLDFAQVRFVSLCVVGFHSFSRGFTWVRQVSLGFVQFNPMSPSFAQFCLVSPGFFHCQTFSRLSQPTLIFSLLKRFAHCFGPVCMTIVVSCAFCRHRFVSPNRSTACDSEIWAPTSRTAAPLFSPKTFVRVSAPCVSFLRHFRDGQWPQRFRQLKNC